MKNRQLNSLGASALQITLSVALLCIVAILFASNFKAAPTAAQAKSKTTAGENAFYPPLPAHNLPPMPDVNPHRSPTPPPTCTPIDIDDKISTGDPKENGRINPTGTATSCGMQNSCSTIPGLYHYRSYNFNNGTGADACITAILSTNCIGTNALFGAAYLDSFDPANPCTNLIGDSGTVTNGTNLSFSFNVPNGSDFVVVVNETTAGAGCEFFKLDIEGLCPQPQPTPTPTPQECEGAFTIGDQDAVVGNHVYFWGSQWARHNHLTGGMAPDAFKGFANCGMPLSCGGAFTSSPGNTPGEPDTIPQFITVIVAHLVTQSGPVINGDIPNMAVVRTEPGYEANPGHPGTGTVMSLVCTAARPSNN